MKFQIARDRFLTSFQVAASVAPNKSPKDILKYVKCIASEGRISLSATDMDHGVKLELTGAAEQDGSCLFHAERMLRILKETDADDIEFELNGTDLRIAAGKADFKLSTANPYEHPGVELIKDGETITLDKRAICQGLKFTSFATDSESSRYALGGVNIELDGGVLNFIGTDGRRLSRFHIDDIAGKDMRGIVPTRACQLLARTLVSEGDAEIRMTHNHLQVTTERGCLWTRLVEGRYPSWRQVIPDRDGSTFEVHVGSLLSCVRQASITTEKESRGVNMTISSGLLTMASKTADVGASKSEIPIAYEGAEIDVVLDHRYALDYLQALDPLDVVGISMVSSHQTVLLTSGNGSEYVIMPMSKDQ